MKNIFTDKFCSLKRALIFRCVKKNLTRYISDNVMSEMISVDAMLCQSAAIAESKFKDNPEKLMEIIKTHHVALETLLQKMGIIIVRSLPGSEFDSDNMTALSQVVDTNISELHGMVASSVSPRFLIKDGADSEKLLQQERVILYCYKEN